MFRRPGCTQRTQRRISGLAVLVFALVLLCGDGGVDAYRFFDSHWSDFPTARTAQLWSTTHWGPGDTLSWVVDEDPGWTAGWEDWRGNQVAAPFRNAQEVLPRVAAALTAWSDVASADIRWEVMGMEEDVDLARDGRMTVTVDAGLSAGAVAVTWQSRSPVGRWRNGRWYTTECDVELNPWAASGLGRDQLSTLIHEFGHCIGLHHAAVAPHSYHVGRHRDSYRWGVWGPSPQMSYGPEAGNELHPDDIVGVSLLRPAPAWLTTRGTITGAVTVAGEPASYVSVWGLRLSGGDPERGVGAFTDGEGRFVIEGLAPGDYLIRAGPMLRPLAHSVLSHDATLDVNDTFELDLVTVFPGIVSDGVVLDLLPSRGYSTPGRSGRGVRLANRGPGSTPCPGLKTWALPPVLSANGELVTTVTIERSPSGAGISLDLLNPYVVSWDGSTDPLVSATSIRAWRAESRGDVVRHEFDVEWVDAPQLPDSDFRIGFRGGSCSGTPAVVCSAGRCDLTR